MITLEWSFTLTQPFSYYGGKQKIAHHIIPLIPKHTVYVEPFCGGATIFFNKPKVKVNPSFYREVLNDTNHLIYNFFNVLRDHPRELFHKIKYSLYSEHEYKLSKQDYSDNIEKAYYFYINIRQSFAKTYNSGWGRDLKGQNSASTYQNQKKNVIHSKNRLKNCYISCSDAIKCIKNWDTPHTFFYCDPPYPETRQGHYEGYTQENFDQLIQALDQCKGSFILSCYQNIAVPKEWEQFEFDSVMSASPNKTGERKRVECVWRRFPAEVPRQEILEIYKKREFDCFVRNPFELDNQPDLFSWMDSQPALNAI